MANPRPEKVAKVEELERHLKGASVVILTDYRGLTVDEIGALRARLREVDLEYRVAKNTLLTLAARRLGLAGLPTFLNGPTAVVFGRDDPGVPARVLQEFIRQYRKLEIKGGLVEGEALDAESVCALAALPSRAELLARVIGGIQGPLRMLVTVLSSTPRALVSTLDALRAQREAAEPKAAPAPVAAQDAATAAPPDGDQPAQAADAPPVPTPSSESPGGDPKTAEIGSETDS